MYCQKCGQRPANVHLVKVTSGVKEEQHLCSQCAAESELAMPLLNFSHKQILSDFLEQPFQPTITPKCDICGTSFDDFTKSGLFGCPDCYETFGDRLTEPLKRLHGATKHIGKTPARLTPKKPSVAALKKQLEQAVASENYEKAAELRDVIRNMEVE